MTKALALVATIVFLFSACSAHVWEDPGTITPVSYQRLEGRIERSVGKLRRLLLVPARYREGKQWFADAPGSSTVDKEDAVSRELTSAALRVLSEYKGYEVIPLHLYEDMSPERLGVSAEELEKQIEALAEWARSSGDGQASPEQVARIVSSIGRPFNADGILIIQGSRRYANFTTLLTILTASLTWPLIFLEGKEELRADVYEVSTGKIVWRRIRTGPIAWPDLPPLVADLFRELEHAVPRALIQE